MAEQGVDQIAAVKASLELMISETEEVHEYFTDLVEKLGQLDALEPPVRRQKFTDLVELGAFRFNGLDIRHFIRAQTSRPLPPPLFLSRTRRRLKNTGVMVREFKKREIFDQADQLLEEIDQLSSNIVNGDDHKEVMAFKDRVEELRGSKVFNRYMDARKHYVQKDPDLKSDSEFIAAREAVEEGEELLRQRAEELAELADRLDNGGIAAEEAGTLLGQMSFEKAPSSA